MIGKRIVNALTTTKMWLKISYIAAIILSVIVCILSFVGNDSSQVTIICGIVWGEVAATTATYHYKSKAENKVKIAMGLVDKLADKYGIENVVNMMQNILNS